MVEEVEEFVEEDRKMKECIDLCNSFEMFVYNMKNTIFDFDKFVDKFDDDDKNMIEEVVKEIFDWLDEN